MASLASEEFSELRKNFKNFKDELKTAINSRNITDNIKCYLIKKQWDTDIDKIFNNNNFNKFHSGRFRHTNITTNSNNLPNEPPEIINDFNILIECLKNGEQIILESYDLIESVLGKYKIKRRFQKNYLVYSASNNKIILEYPNKNELLLFEKANLITDGISNTSKINKIVYYKNFRAKDSSKQEFFEYLLSNTNFKDLNLERYQTHDSQIKINEIYTDILNIDKKVYPSTMPNISSPRHLRRKFENSNEEPKNQIKETPLETPKGNQEVENRDFIPNKFKTKRYHFTNQSTGNSTKGENLNTTNDNNLKYERNREIHNEPIIKSRSSRAWSIINQREKNENFNIQNNINEEALKREIEKLKKDNTALNETNNELKENNIKLNKDALTNKREIEKLNRDINSLNYKLKDKDRIIDKLQNDINNINKEEKSTKFQPQERKYFSGRSRIERTSQQSLDKDYQKNIDNLEKEKNSLLNKLNDLENKYSEKEKKYQKENKENDDLYAENQDLKKKEKEYNKKLSKIETEKNDKISKISYELEDKIEYTKEILKENDKLKDNEKKYLKEIKDMEVKEKNYLSKINEYELNINKKEKDFQKQINNLEKEKNDFEKKYLEMKEEYDKEYKENDDLYDENQDLKKKEKEYNKKIKELEDKIKNNEKEYNNKITKLEKENKINISKMEIELNDKKNYIDEIKKENEKSKNKEKENIKEKKNIENKHQLELKEYQNIINNLEYELKELKKNNNEINTEINNLYNENDSLKNKEIEYLDKIKNLEMKLKEKNDKNDKLNQKKLKEINEKMMFLENKESELENENQKIESIKKELEKIRKELDEEKINISNERIQLNNQINSNNNINNINNFTNDMNRGFDGFNTNQSPMNPMNFGMIQNSMFNTNGTNNINNLNNNEFSKDTKSNQNFLDYDEPTLIGLNNIGATCYLNSTLQCLSQTEALTKYFLNKKNKDKIFNNNIAKKNKKALQLCPVYYDLIQNLWKKNNFNKSFSPNDFMNTIESMNSLFKKGQAGDSKDFIIFILEQIHNELKHSMGNNKEPNNPLNQYDKNNAFEHFLYDFKNDLSIISDIFFGLNQTTNVCLNCKNNYNSRNLANPICYNYGIFNVIIFPLEEVKNMKNRNNFMMRNNNIVELNDCFYFNQKTDFFTGENKNYCNICRKLWDSEYTSHIYSSPNVLILILNRGKNNIYNVKINFQEKIDISKFVLVHNSTQVYNLYGVITHLGESGPNAHFVASCKSPVDGYWYRYNDAMVTPIYNFMKEIHDFGKPYILFYQKDNK